MCYVCSYLSLAPSNFAVLLFLRCHDPRSDILRRPTMAPWPLHPIKQTHASTNALAGSRYLIISKLTSYTSLQMRVKQSSRHDPSSIKHQAA